MKSKVLLPIAVSLLFAELSSAEELIDSYTLKNFEEVDQWHLAKEVKLDEGELRKFVIKPAKKGKLLVNAVERVKRLPYLFTKDKFGDVEVVLEFMVPKGSNSGVYLMGRYEVQITDSYGKSDVKFSDIGGIYERVKDDDYSDERAKGYEGIPPLENASKAPGEWQKLEIKFRAPRFSKKKKVKDAFFESVRLNGKLVQENVSVTGPTVSHPLNGEEAKGPVVIQGDHGPIVIRSFVVKNLRN